MDIILIATFIILVTCHPVTLAANDSCSNCKNNECIIAGEEDRYCLKGCKVGFHGNNCSKPCPSFCSVCSKYFDTDSICYSCNNGFYKDDYDYSTKSCSGTCPSSCIACRDRHSCTRCKPGFYGQACQYKCPYCKEGCEQYDGGCTGDCEAGYHGIRCDRACSNDCTNSTCEKYSGECHTCKAGQYGKNCRYRCKEYCMECNEDMKECSICNEGYYGDQCELACLDECNGTCDRNSGNCFSGCKKGWYGFTCSEECGEGCESYCSQSNGSCLQNCKTGYHGSKCDLKCGDGCPSACKKDSGACSMECIDGKFGYMCQSTCPWLCQKCTSSSNCSSCKHGHFGLTCEWKCSEGCLNNVCDRVYGTCEQGCKEGLAGRLCDVERYKDSGLTVGASLGTILAVIVVAGLIFGAFLFIKKRRNLAKATTREVVTNNTAANNFYEHLRFGENAHQSTSAGREDRHYVNLQLGKV